MNHKRISHQKKHFNGFGNFEHSKAVANLLLKDRKEGSTIQITYDNGYANFIVKDNKVVIA